jgi:hypothetical protein
MNLLYRHGGYWSLPFFFNTGHCLVCVEGAGVSCSAEGGPFLLIRLGHCLVLLLDFCLLSPFLNIFLLYGRAEFLVTFSWIISNLWKV